MLQVVDLDTLAAGKTLTDAQAAFHTGTTIIRVRGTAGEEPKDLLGLPVSKSFARERQTRADKNGRPLEAAHERKLTVRGYAVYTKPNGVIRMVRSFAPAAADDQPTSVWRQRLDEWIAKEQASAALGAEDDPAPPAQAWTLLSSITTQYTSTPGNFEQNTVEIFRLNTIQTAYDYYMVYAVPETKPNYYVDQYNTFCDGFDYCGWHTISRDFEMQPPSGGILVDHGPTGTITTQDASFSIGGSLSSEGPGISAGFSVGWSQPSVVTTDGSDGTNAQWTENMTFSGVACDPVVGEVPPVSSGTYFSRQGAIFRVPGGTQQLTIPVKAHSHFCATFDFGGNVDDITIQQNILAGPPILAASPVSLTIPAAGSAYLSVAAAIPFSSNGLPWIISTNQSWLTVPTQGPFSTGQLIPVSVAQGTPLGSTGTISINTTPPFAAPSVLVHPIEVSVTVGKAQQNNVAGVLLLGGLSADNTIQSMAEFYDATAKFFLPVGAMVTPRAVPSTTRLPSGEVLIVGGATAYNDGFQQTVTATAEIFHPDSRNFTSTGSLAVARQNQSATLLPDGKVLIVGGSDGSNNFLGSAELYDPATGTFSPAGTLATARSSHGATVISPPGQPAKVLIYGGGARQILALNSSEIWDESTKSFSAGPNMAGAQAYFPQPDAGGVGQLKIVGGFDNTSYTAAEQILTIAGPSFAVGQNLNVSRFGHSLTRLNDGSLLAAGGENKGNFFASAELQEGGGAWSLVSSSANCAPGSSGCMTIARIQHTATLLPDGTVLITGGSDETGAILGSSELYNSSTKTFSVAVPGALRTYHNAIPIATTSVNLTAAPSPAVAGQTVNLVASLSAAVGTPTGSVQFLDGSTVIGSAIINSSGEGTLSTSALTVGTHTLTAIYEGDQVFSGSKSDQVPEIINQIPTTIGLNSSPNPSNLGQAVTFTANITSSDSKATGTVTFRDGTTTVGTANVTSNAAVLMVTTLSVGPHSIVATYNGDGTHAGSVSSAVAQIVSQRTTTTALQVTPATSSYGQSVMLTARVTAQSGSPTGTVAFTDGQTLLGRVALSNGSAVLTTASLTAGSHSLGATYSGDPTFDTSSSPAQPYSVSQGASSITVRSNRNPSSTGQPVTFFGTVTGAGATPTGTVNFYDGGNQIGGAQPLINGTANISTASLAVGPHQITASYSGDTNNISSASSAITQVVQGASTATGITSSANPASYGQNITLIAAVSGGATAPTGNVAFSDGTSSLGTIALTNGAAQLNTAALSTGAHIITASYAGDASHSASVSRVLMQRVTAATTVTALTSSPNPATTGTVVVLSASVSSAAGTPAGSVRFFDGTSAIGTSPVNSSGAAQLQTTTLAVGTHLITARYLASGNFAASTSNQVTQRIQAPQPVQTTTDVDLDPPTIFVDDDTTITVTVTTSSGAIPGGNITLTSALEGPIGNFNLVRGRATVPYSPKNWGKNTITATYNGNARFASSTGAETLDVQAPPAPITSSLLPLEGSSKTSTTGPKTALPNGSL